MALLAFAGKISSKLSARGYEVNMLMIPNKARYSKSPPRRRQSLEI